MTQAFFHDILVYKVYSNKLQISMYRILKYDVKIPKEKIY